MRLVFAALALLGASLWLLAAQPAECQDCWVGPTCYTSADCYGSCVCLQTEPGQYGKCVSASAR